MNKLKQKRNRRSSKKLLEQIKFDFPTNSDYTGTGMKQKNNFDINNHKLPDNIFENIVTKEMELSLEFDHDKLASLCQLYFILIQYYSCNDPSKIKLYQNRMEIHLSQEHTLKNLSKYNTKKEGDIKEEKKKNSLISEKISIIKKNYKILSKQIKVSEIRKKVKLVLKDVAILMKIDKKNFKDVISKEMKKQTERLKEKLSQRRSCTKNSLARTKTFYHKVRNTPDTKMRKLLEIANKGSFEKSGKNVFKYKMIDNYNDDNKNENDSDYSDLLIEVDGGKSRKANTNTDSDSDSDSDDSIIGDNYPDDESIKNEGDEEEDEEEEEEEDINEEEKRSYENKINLINNKNIHFNVIKEIDENEEFEQNNVNTKVKEVNYIKKNILENIEIKNPKTSSSKYLNKLMLSPIKDEDKKEKNLKEEEKDKNVKEDKKEKNVEDQKEENVKEEEKEEKDKNVKEEEKEEKNKDIKEEEKEEKNKSVKEEEKEEKDKDVKEEEKEEKDKDVKEEEKEEKDKDVKEEEKEEKDKDVKEEEKEEKDKNTKEEEQKDNNKNEEANIENNKKEEEKNENNINEENNKKEEKNNENIINDEENDSLKYKKETNDIQDDIPKPVPARRRKSIDDENVIRKIELSDEIKTKIQEKMEKIKTLINGDISDDDSNILSTTSLPSVTQKTNPEKIPPHFQDTIDLIEEKLKTYVGNINKHFYLEMFDNFYYKLKELYDNKYKKYIQVNDEYHSSIKENEYMIDCNDNISENEKQRLQNIIDGLKEEQKDQIDQILDEFNNNIKNLISDFKHNLFKNNVGMQLIEEQLKLDIYSMINEAFY